MKTHTLAILAFTVMPLTLCMCIHLPCATQQDLYYTYKLIDEHLRLPRDDRLGAPVDEDGYVHCGYPEKFPDKRSVIDDTEETETSMLTGRDVLNEKGSMGDANDPCGCGWPILLRRSEEDEDETGGSCNATDFTKISKLITALSDL
ncbi:hypothetical protein JCM33374_g3237 [Metschnikowia sp. JCM 33374]|nr:hypothetical protein JCM33374_g3237 [Metschnikowia sp. JCM 33374]